jgi:hypothetical protein
MADEQRKIGWLAKRREKRRLKQERTGDSGEKRVQRHTSRGEELAAKDAALRPEGGGEGGGSAF